jgi:hypothetical protein
VDESRTAESGDLSSRTVSRRTVIRTAAHAAWVVPAIQVVSAAPAFAVSPKLTISVGNPVWGGDRLTVTFTVVAENGAASNIQIFASAPGPNRTLNQRFSIPAGSNPGGLWALPQGSVNGTTNSFLLSRATSLSSSSTFNLVCRWQNDGDVASGTQLTITVSNVTATPAGFTFVFPGTDSPYRSPAKP